MYGLPSLDGQETELFVYILLYRIVLKLVNKVGDCG
jgi:hypothetical protein